MIKLLGIPYDGNSSFLKGPAMAPQRIRLMEKEGSANTFAEDGTDISAGKNYMDLGDMIFENFNPENVFHTIKKNVHAALADNDPLILFGGDHSVSYPIINAFSEKYKGLHVLHFDAHADLYDNFGDNPY